MADEAAGSVVDRERSGLSRSGTVRSLGVVTAGTLVANLLAYLVQLPAGRLLGPAGYGEFSVLQAAMLVLSVPALALQAVVAREVVRGAGRAQLWRLIAVVTLALAVAGVLVAAVMMPLADVGLPSAAAALAGAAPLAVIAGGQGLIQGAGRFGVLGLLLALVGVARTVPIIVAVLAGGGPVAALWSGTAGSVVAAVIVGAAAHRSGSPGSGSAGSGAAGSGAAGTVDARAVLWASGVQLVVIVAVSLDLLLSRAVLSADDAGVYALGAVATKAAFWLPQAIGVVVYPRLADPVRSAGVLGAAVRVLAIIGLLVTLAAAVAGPLVPVLVSADYRPVASLMWLFAGTGAMLAVLQLLLLSAIARDRARGGLPAGAVLVVEVVLIALLAHSVLSLAIIAAVSATLSVLLTGLWIRLASG
ncbi:polysaccharide biosynthesis protein [Gordonia sp. VNK21]|uniref:polysaccharide biosynthesis protein n=1 Tax=Gordonia sp. VNK21 TaxID=3382483 RepID=UPI0038D4B9A2